MEDRKLLIVGIDPGTTTAFAVLDIEGNLLHLASSKQLDLSRLISEAIKFGKVVLVGTDKAKSPSLVESFAAKLGARVIHPEEDLKVEEKRKMAYGFNFYDEHQADALASALFAHKSARPLLDKIDFFASKNKRQGIKNKIKELVLAKRISIKNAVGIIEKKDEESIIVENVIVEKKLSEADFLRIYGKLKGCEAEIKLVKMHNSSLKREIGILKGLIGKKEAREEEKKPADFRDKRIRFLGNMVSLKEKESWQLKLLVERFNRLVSNMGSFHILKKLDTLGAGEFDFKNKILNIQKNDMLLVDNPNIASSSTVDFLTDRVFIIIHKKPVSKKIENSLPFVFIDSKGLKIDEDRYFGFIEKRHFETEKNKVNWAKKVIDDYKKEKEQLIAR